MTREEELYASEFDRTFACRHGYPRKIADNKNDPGYEAAKWAWDFQQNTINLLRRRENAVRMALHDIGIG